MDREAILSVLSFINAELIQEGSRNIQCKCFLESCEKSHSHLHRRRASMGISISPDGPSLVHCLSCKFGGTLTFTISKYSKETGKDLSELIKKIVLIEQQDPELLLGRVPPYFEPYFKDIDILVDEQEIEHMKGLAHKYVLDRGIDLDTLRIWECGFDSSMRRVVFPVRNFLGQLVGAVGRTVNNHPMKYFNYFDFNKSKYVFGEHLAKGGSLIVVEGLLDVVSVWQALRKENALEEFSVVGLLGANPSRKQLEKIKALSNEVILFLDNDSAGKEGTEKIIRLLSKSLFLTVVSYPESEDCNDPDDVARRGYSISDLARSAPLAMV